MTQGEAGFGIYMQDRMILNHQHSKAWAALEIEPDRKGEFKKLPKDEMTARELTAWMCRNFYDIPTFGAVMSTEVNCGQVRGPVQFSFARSVEPIMPLEISITRMAATNAKDAESKGDIRTIGRKYIVPYALYRAHGYVSANLANDAKKGTGFSERDLALFWRALSQMFDHDRSAARGEMAARKLLIFRHDSALGNAPAHRLFDLVNVCRKGSGSTRLDLGSDEAAKLPPARRYDDYEINVFAPVPRGVTLIDMPDTYALDAAE
jgi:CRISPR-associated protein Csd2